MLIYPFIYQITHLFTNYLKYLRAKYGDYEYATIGSVVNKNFDSRFEVICLKILGTELSAWAT